VVCGQGRNRWRAFVNTAMNVGIPCKVDKRRNFAAHVEIYYMVLLKLLRTDKDFCENDFPYP
jgi:hypothetical protein